jgi:hypothetical protein
MLSGQVGSIVRCHLTCAYVREADWDTEAASTSDVVSSGGSGEEADADDWTDVVDDEGAGIQGLPSELYGSEAGGDALTWDTEEVDQTGAEAAGEGAEA